MSVRDSIRKMVGLGVFTAGAVFVYINVVRPKMMRWGATDEELGKTLPGDELVPQPLWSFTQAVTIHTEPQEVWPWLVQWGYGRGGFYSFDWLDSVLEAGGVSSADKIIVEFQNLQPGSTIPVEPTGNGFRVDHIEENRSIVLSNRLNLETMQPFEMDDPRPLEYLNVSWAWVLERLGGCRTRLISRAQVDMKTRNIPALDLLLGEPLKPGSAFMDWGMLQGIKRRAEAAGCTANDA